MKDLLCSWFRVPKTSFTAAYGRPEPSRMFNHSCVVCLVVSASMRSSNSLRLRTRSLLVTYLGSLLHSDLPSFSHRMPNSRSLAPPTKISPSAVLKPWYGTTDAGQILISKVLSQAQATRDV